ncbi:cell cycle checkpoint protein RAD17 isoform X2 [Topomyia yanbarensis]|uniref:cell cycle checkpoint protein RAD17 isoform X2 n=1 Tax=Topomyia yanbarensis TaxID=2498891 RepID=UPI00273BF5F1|nr:cell cycle checkpoint protein RAD17 isoform X2 [Topomyia yanbarensis]
MSSNNKRWFKSAFDDEIKPVPVKRTGSLSEPSANHQPSAAKAPKLTKTNSFTFAVPAVPAATGASQIDWSVDLAPRTVTDLAVHPKKLDEIQQWFRTYDRVRDSEPVAILLVSGPPGCGKSTTVKTIAEDLGYRVAEWTTPADMDLFFHDNYDFENDRQETTYRENQQKLFDKFLYKTSRYCSIFETAAEQKLLLVKDFPNVFLRDPTIFLNSLESYQAVGASPLVFIATETSNKKLDIVFNLFPPDVLLDFKIHHITFNSVSATLMKKAVKRITSLMVGADMARHYRVPSQELIESIILSSLGDLRNVTLNLHFASLKNAPRLSTEAVNAGGRVLNTSGVVTGRGKKKEKKLKSVGCNENLTLMHALGRVFNPKYEETVKGEEKFHHSPEDLTDAFTSQPGSMISLIHSNYVLRFTDIEDIKEAADALSLSDVIMSEYREDLLASYGLNIAVRGTMVHNRKTAGGWQQIRKKKVYSKPSVTSHEGQLKKYGLETSSISAGLFKTDYKRYLDIIQAGRV